MLKVEMLGYIKNRNPGKPEKEKREVLSPVLSLMKLSPIPTNTVEIEFTETSKIQNIDNNKVKRYERTNGIWTD